MKIFVQIASYRDPQLIPTIKSMLENAEKPENLVIGICRQYHPEDGFDNLDQFKEDVRFRIIDVLHNESKGACWARNQLQQLYKDEDYTLQIDSHMRFEKSWDKILIKMIKQLQNKGFNKPLLTAYVSSFDPEDDPAKRIKEPWRMVFDRFIPEGAVFFLPETIPDWEKLTEPVPSRFYSAHMAFTLGKFSIEVQHDPEFYFHGEEISIAARAFTHGYDLFHPHKTVIWHEYTRKGRVKQWDDDKEWFKKNDISHKKNRKLFCMDGEVILENFDKYGFGIERTLRDYEIYSGLNFSLRSVQQYTLDKHYPPNPNLFKNEEERLASYLNVFKHCIDIYFSQVTEVDYEFWAVAFHNNKNETIFRKDADADEIKNMMNDPDGYCKVWRDFQTNERPAYWVVWPFSKSKGWCERITGNL